MTVFLLEHSVYAESMLNLPSDYSAIANIGGLFPMTNHRR